MSCLFLLFPYFCLHNLLTRDSSMIETGHPHHFISFHSLISNDQILNCQHKSMTKMKRTSHIWRRQHHDVRCFLLAENLLFISMEEPRLRPPLIPMSFNKLRVKICRQLLWNIFLRPRRHFVCFYFDFIFAFCFRLIFLFNLLSFFLLCQLSPLFKSVWQGPEQIIKDW